MNWWGGTLPAIAPRFVMRSELRSPPNPVCIYSEATRKGGSASLTFLAIPGHAVPILPYWGARKNLQSSAASAETNIFELCDAVAAVPRL